MWETLTAVESYKTFFKRPQIASVGRYTGGAARSVGWLVGDGQVLLGFRQSPGVLCSKGKREA